MILALLLVEIDLRSGARRRSASVVVRGAGDSLLWISPLRRLWGVPRPLPAQPLAALNRVAVAAADGLVHPEAAHPPGSRDAQHPPPPPSCVDAPTDPGFGFDCGADGRSRAADGRIHLVVDPTSDDRGRRVVFGWSRTSTSAAGGGGEAVASSARALAPLAQPNTPLFAQSRFVPLIEI